MRIALKTRPSRLYSKFRPIKRQFKFTIPYPIILNLVSSVINSSKPNATLFGPNSTITRIHATNNYWKTKRGKRSKLNPILTGAWESDGICEQSIYFQKLKNALRWTKAFRVERWTPKNHKRKQWAGSMYWGLFSPVEISS